MPVRVHEYVRVEALVLVHAECAVVRETERRVMFAHDVRREMDRVDDPQNDEEPPFPGGKEPHGRTPRTGRQTTTSPPSSVPGNVRTTKSSICRLPTGPKLPRQCGTSSRLATAILAVQTGDFCWKVGPPRRLERPFIGEFLLRLSHMRQMCIYFVVHRAEKNDAVILTQAHQRQAYPMGPLQL